MLRVAIIALFGVLPLFSQPKKILVAYNNPDLIEKLSATGPEVRVVPVTEPNVMTEIADADAFVGEITSAEVRAAKNLKWVAIMSAGVERVLFPKDGSDDLRQSNIILTNNKVVQGP